MGRWARKLAVVLAAGYILFFYSERMFWSFLRPGDKVAEILITWVVYSILAWVVLLLVRQCRIATFPAVFLAGAVFGWLAEGVVVDTMYGNDDNPFPASISFTGLAWHALISAGVGWYWQAKVLTGGKLRSITLFSTVVGLGWGLWAGWWPAELGAENASFTGFATHSLACFIPLAAAWMVLGMAGSEWFRPGTGYLLVFRAMEQRTTRSLAEGRTGLGPTRRGRTERGNAVGFRAQAGAPPTGFRMSTRA
jgi:hypothetical protein